MLVPTSFVKIANSEFMRSDRELRTAPASLCDDGELFVIKSLYLWRQES